MLLFLLTLFSYFLIEFSMPQRIAQGEPEDELEKCGFYPIDERTPEEKETISYKDRLASDGRVSLYTELSLLFEREKRSIIRNKAPLVANLAITAFLSVLYGIFFLGVGRLDRTNPNVRMAVVVSNRFQIENTVDAFHLISVVFVFLQDTQAQLGAIVNVLISTMMGQSQVSLTTFPTERPLFLREYSTNHYSVVAYFTSKLATEALQSFVAILVQVRKHR